MKTGKSCRFISHVFVHWKAGNLLCPTHAGERLCKTFSTKEEFFFCFYETDHHSDGKEISRWLRFLKFHMDIHRAHKWPVY